MDVPYAQDPPCDILTQGSFAMGVQGIVLEPRQVPLRIPFRTIPFRVVETRAVHPHCHYGCVRELLVLAYASINAQACCSQVNVPERTRCTRTCRQPLHISFSNVFIHQLQRELLTHLHVRCSRKHS
jgi:hypothetical protein